MAEAEVLGMARETQLRANESLHTQAEDDAVRPWCKQLIDAGVDAVDRPMRKRHPERQQRLRRRQYPGKEQELRTQD